MLARTKSQLLLCEVGRFPDEGGWVDAPPLLLLYPLVLLYEGVRDAEYVLVLVELEHLQCLGAGRSNASHRVSHTQPDSVA